MTATPNTQSKSRSAGKFLGAAALSLVGNLALAWAIATSSGSSFEFSAFLFFLANVVVSAVFLGRRQYSITAGIWVGLLGGIALAIVMIINALSHWVVG